MFAMLIVMSTAEVLIEGSPDEAPPFLYAYPRYVYESQDENGRRAVATIPDLPSQLVVDAAEIPQLLELFGDLERMQREGYSKRGSKSVAHGHGTALDSIGTNYGSVYPLLTKQGEAVLGRSIMAAQQVQTDENIASGLTLDQIGAFDDLGIAAFDLMLASNVRLVFPHARRLAAVISRGTGGKDKIDEELAQDLFMEGRLGLEHGINMFDFRKGFKFSTYATWWIKQALMRARDMKYRPIPLPYYKGDRVRQMHRVGIEVDEKYGPLDNAEREAKIADQLGVKPEKLAGLRLDDSRTGNLVALDSPIGDDADGISFADVLASPEQDVEQVVFDAFDSESLITKVRAILPPHEADFLMRAAGVGVERISLKELSRQHGFTEGYAGAKMHQIRAMLLHPSTDTMGLREFEPWRRRAACFGVRLNLFFPRVAQNGHGLAELKGICGSCPVRQECINFANTHDVRAGFWGDTDAAGKPISRLSVFRNGKRERIALKLAAQRAAAAEDSENTTDS